MDLATRISVVVFAFASWNASPISAQVVEFVKIADSTTQFMGGGSPCRLPAINNSGQVAYIAHAGTSPFGSTRGVFVSDGGAVTTIATGPNDRYDPDPVRCYGPDINGSGKVAFWQSLGANEHGLFVGDGGPLATIADTLGSFASIDLGSSMVVPSINDSGAVPFVAAPEANPGRATGVYVGNGITTTPLYDEAGTGLRSFNAWPRINDAGQVAFWGYSLTSGGLYVGTGPSLSRRFDHSSNWCTSIVHQGLDGSGRVPLEFTTRPSCVDITIELRGPAGTAQVASTSPLPPHYGSLALSEGGRMALVITPGNGQSAIHLKTPSGFQRIVGLGDALFGSIVTRLWLGSNGINDLGEVAFRYQLSNAREGYARTEVPEPAAPLSLAIGIVFLSSVRRGRTRSAGTEPRAWLPALRRAHHSRIGTWA